jgi:hypothetical protein
MFVLCIFVSPPAVELMKSALTKSMPQVKSSHRVEALGRALGFRSYAALLAASQSPTPPIVQLSGGIFLDYLKGRGFEVDAANLYRAAALVAIRRVLDDTPKLHIHGLGFGRPQRNVDGSWQTSQQRYDEFLAGREECFGLHAAEAFLRSLALLAQVKETKTIRSGAGSYRLKHIAENYVCTYPEGGKLGPDYVPNGTLIAAALHMGFKYKTDVDALGYDTLNATFNMSKAVIEELDAEIRPGTGFAYDRAKRRQLANTRKQFAATKTMLSI